MDDITITFTFYEIQIITDALDMWKEKIPETFDSPAQTGEATRVNDILTKISAWKY